MKNSAALYTWHIVVLYQIIKVKVSAKARVSSCMLHAVEECFQCLKQTFSTEGSTNGNKQAAKLNSLKSESSLSKNVGLPVQDASWSIRYSSEANGQPVLKPYFWWLLFFFFWICSFLELNTLRSIALWIVRFLWRVHIAESWTSVQKCWL